jgi:hypothetical protein
VTSGGRYQDLPYSTGYQNKKNKKNSNEVLGNMLRVQAPK